MDLNQQEFHRDKQCHPCELQEESVSENEIVVGDSIVEETKKVEPARVMSH